MNSSALPLSRALLALLACLAWAVLPSPAYAKDTDSNALGFKAYEKGDYKKAHGLFEKALESAELLLPKGAEIVRTVGRGDKVKRFHTKAAPVLSRLQRFDFKRIGPAEIRARWVM